MITFSVALILLVAGYFLYGKLMERVMKPDANATTPAVAHPDGVDYIAMPGWKLFMIQFLNIAGLGPIFGAIMGAKFGVSAYLWIVLGTIFGGAVHDYVSGMVSLRNNGESLPEIAGRYLGNGMKQFSRVFTAIILVLVCAVFVSGPAELLEDLTGWNIYLLMGLVMLYYLLATILPIDKIIGKIYPLFAFCLLFMAFGVLITLYVLMPDLPEITEGLTNTQPDPDTYPIFPMMFISIACGAISGFHATQSPLVARCMTNEKQGRSIFYGAMVAEGIVALIWAAAAIWYFQENGYAENNAAIVVDKVTRDLLGTVGAVIAILGVVAAPISTGDTALRSCRLIIADILHYPQAKIKSRLAIAIPIYAFVIVFLVISVVLPDGFNIIWRYFAWSNQTLAVMTLWAMTVFLYQAGKPYVITLVPAVFMTWVTTSYILFAPEGFGVAYYPSMICGLVAAFALMGLFYYRAVYLDKKTLKK